MTESTTIVENKCPFCGEYNRAEVSTAGYLKFLRGEPISKVLPKLSREDRELLMTGICTKCWKELPE